MNPKIYAKSRKLTLKQCNDLCKLVLEQVPVTLTETQISRLDAALAAAAEQVAALPASDEADTQTALEEAPPSEIVAELTKAEAGQADMLQVHEAKEIAQTRQVIDVLGEETLRRNVTIFLTHHIKSLQRLSETHSAILHKFEQDIYHQTGETFGRMTRHMEQTFADAERIANPQTGEDEQLYQDYLGLVNEFLSTPP
jgi:hypothetical protein